MNTNNTSLIEKIESSKTLDFGIIFSESIELFKKTWLQGFLLQIVTLVIMFPLIFVLYIPIIGMLIKQQENGYFDSGLISGFFASMSILYLLLIVVGFFFIAALSLALKAGFYRIIKKIDYAEVVSTSDFFYFIKGKYFGKVFMLMVISILIAIPAILLCYIPYIYAMVPFSFFSLIFAFNPELAVLDVVKVSFKLGNKKWLISFGLIIVSTLLAQMVGFMLCFVGLLFTATFVNHPIYLIYKHVIGFKNGYAIDEIGVYKESF